VVLDDAGVPLEAALTVGMAHRNVVRTVAWVTDRSSRASAPASAPPSAPTSRAASNDISDGCAVLSDLCMRVGTPDPASGGANIWGCFVLGPPAWPRCCLASAKPISHSRTDGYSVATWQVFVYVAVPSRGQPIAGFHRSNHRSAAALTRCRASSQPDRRPNIGDLRRAADALSPEPSSASTVTTTAGLADAGHVWLLLEFCNKGTVQASWRMRTPSLLDFTNSEPWLDRASGICKSTCPGCWHGCVTL